MTGHLLIRLYSRFRETARTFLPRPLFELLYNWAWRLKAAVGMARLAKIEIVPPSHPRGVNLIGDINSGTGLGESCRILAEALRSTREKLAIIPFPPNSRPKADSRPLYDLNIIHIAPQNLSSALRRLGRGVWDGRYNIAFWLWELEKFPAAWRPAFGLFNEIWTPSEFISRAIRNETGLPVVTMPYAIRVQARPEHERRYFGLPEDCFLVLIAADSRSFLERKNPLGAAEAFVKAFPPEEESKAGLVVKLHRAPKLFRKKKKKMLAGYSRIYFMENCLAREEFNGLLKSVDVFLSPHKAEGFGLVLAEAMYLGTPCVATNWSANTEFMTPETAVLLDYELVQIGRNFGPFPKEGRWAEPDIAQAAAGLRRLASEPAFSQTLSEAAARHIRANLNSETLVARIEQRLQRIRSNLWNSTKGLTKS
jgi:glycosyltransferase involved in cell wall biosynthesis